MWNESDWIVDDVYNTASKINSPKATHQFKNTLAVNKGDITTARCLDSNDLISFSPEFGRKSPFGRRDGGFNTLTIKKEESEFSNLIEISQPRPAFQKYSSEKIKISWEILCKRKQKVESPRILWEMNNKWRR